MDVFAAVADPARRQIMSALARGDLSAGEVAALFPITRPAVSRHLRVLREAGLVRTRLDGRKRLLSLRTDDVDACFPGLLNAVLSAKRSARDQRTPTAA